MAIKYLAKSILFPQQVFKYKKKSLKALGRRSRIAFINYLLQYLYIHTSIYICVTLPSINIINWTPIIDIDNNIKL